MKLSSLFCLVEDLLEENHPLVHAQKRCTTKLLTTADGKKAFLLTPTKTPTAALWEASQNSLKEKPHIRIDQYYSGENSRLSLAHYTEVHSNPTGSRVTIHVYFNEHRHLATTATQSNPDNPDTYTDFTLSTEQKKLLEYRVDVALALFSDLVFERSSRYLEATQKADQFEQALTRRSHSLIEKKHRDEYRRIAMLFSEQIQLINRYSGSARDHSDSMVNRFVSMLDKEDLASKDTSSIETLTTLEPTDDSSTVQGLLTTGNTAGGSQIPSPPADPRIALRLNIEAQLEPLKKLFNQDMVSAQVILEASKKVMEVNDLMLELLFTKKPPRTHSKKKKANPDKTILDQAQEAIDQYHIKKTTLLDKAFWEGDLDSFKALLELFSDYELLKAIEKWFEPLKQPKKKLYSSETIAILNFLSENSGIYKHYESKMERVVYAPTRTSLRYFFMMKLYIDDQHALFEMFLDHGFNPNGIAESVGDNQYIPLIRAVVYLNKHLTTDLYVKKLLEMGARLAISHIDLEPYLDKTTREELASLEAQNPSVALRENMSRVMKLPIFLIAAQEKAYKSIEVMMPYAEGYDLSLALAHLSQTESFKRSVPYHTNHSGIQLYHSETSYTTAITPTLREENRAGVLIFFTVEDQSILRMMKALHTSFLGIHSASRTIETSQKQLDFLLKDSSHFTENDFYVFYTGKIFLIIQEHRNKQLTSDALEKLLINYYSMSAKTSKNKIPCLKMMRTLGDTHSITLTEYSRRLLEKARETLQPAEPTQTPPSVLNQYKTQSTPQAKDPSLKKTPMLKRT